MSSIADPAPITRALRAWRRGDATAEDELIRLVYPGLHAHAERLLRAERADHTLQPTALVNEVYLRLLDQRQVEWSDRLHFFAIAARLMRRVLIDHARRRKRAKRGGGLAPVSLEEAGDVSAATATKMDAEDLDAALRELEAFDAAGAALVELRFFGGLTFEEAAEVRGTSVATAVRQWRVARAWLFARLRAD